MGCCTVKHAWDSKDPLLTEAASTHASQMMHLPYIYFFSPVRPAVSGFLPLMRVVLGKRAVAFFGRVGLGGARARLRIVASTGRSMSLYLVEGKSV